MTSASPAARPVQRAAGRRRPRAAPPPPRPALPRTAAVGPGAAECRRGAEDRRRDRHGVAPRDRRRAPPPACASPVDRTRSTSERRADRRLTVRGVSARRTLRHQRGERRLVELREDRLADRRRVQRQPRAQARRDLHERRALLAEDDHELVAVEDADLRRQARAGVHALDRAHEPLPAGAGAEVLGAQLADEAPEPVDVVVAFEESQLDQLADEAQRRRLVPAERVGQLAQPPGRAPRARTRAAARPSCRASTDAAATGDEPASAASDNVKLRFSELAFHISKLARVRPGRGRRGPCGRGSTGGRVPAGRAAAATRPRAPPARRRCAGRRATERGGFEPPMELAPHNGFRDRRLQPLGHLSRRAHPTERRRRGAPSGRRRSTAALNASTPALSWRAA